MASFTVRLYKNTGFDLTNIPDSWSLLQNCEHFDVDAVWIYQDKINGSIRVKGSYGDMLAVDYLSFSTTSYGYSSCYFVTNVTMINPLTAELSLQLDAITTVGLNQIGAAIAGGWCTRRHVTDDSLFSNCIDEDFLPTEPLEQDTQELTIPNTGILAIVSSIDLSKVSERLSQGYKNSVESTDIDISVPTVPVINFDYTKITIDYQGLKLTRELVGKRMYLLQNDDPFNYFANALTTVWSLGLSDAISGIYYLPIGDEGSGQFSYQATVDLSDKLVWIKELTVNGGVFRLNNIPYKWNTLDIHNNKVFATKFNKYKLISMVSGNSAEYYAGDIYDKINQSTAPNIAINIDASDNGTTYAKPEYIRGVDLSQTSKKFEIMRDAVTGGDWVSMHFNQARPKGITKTLTQLNFERANSFLNIPSNILGKLNLPNLTKNGNIYESFTTPYYPSTNLVSQSQIASGALDQVNPITNYNYVGMPNISGFGDISGVINGLRKSANSIFSNSIAQADAFIQTPETWFPIDNTLSLFYGNSYYVVRERLSDNDTIKFDRYLTEFGYAVNEPMTSDVFKGRQYFNYVKCSDLCLTSIDNIPTYVVDAAIAHLESGVRIWHTLVNKAAFNNNPIAT